MSWIREEETDLSPVIGVMSINRKGMEAVQRLNAAFTTQGWLMKPRV